MTDNLLEDLTTLQYPQVNEVFPLTIDGGVRRFYLAQIGHQRTREELKAALEERGVLAPAEVRQIFKDTYPYSDGKGLIAFAPSAWDHSPPSYAPHATGGIVVPHINSKGVLHVCWFRIGRMDIKFHSSWRWLIEVPPK